MPPIFHSANERETIAVSVLIESLPKMNGRILIAHDSTNRIAGELKQQGCEVEQWWRMHSQGCTATPWPPNGPFDAAILRLSKDKGAFDMALHAVASQVRPGGKIWVYGANDEGIKSSPRRIQAVCEPVTTVTTKRHCRVVQGTVKSEKTTHGLQLIDWQQRVSVDFSTGSVLQHCYPGTFAKGKLDPGTRMLLDTISPRQPNSTVLDYACGSGVLSMGLLATEPSLLITLIDADAVALVAAKQNLPNATVLPGHSLNVLNTQDRFDTIVANPPYHDGKERSNAVVESLIAQSPKHLTESGELWMVVQNQVNIRTLLNQMYSSVERTKEGGYCVWRARSPHR